MRSAKLVMAVVAATALVLSLGYGSANAEYMQDWNTDPGAGLDGWAGSAGIAWSSNGGVGDTGHLKVSRTSKSLPGIRAEFDPVQSATGDDVNAQYGQLVEISLDFKVDTTSPTGLAWRVYDSPTTYWNIDMAGASDMPTTWTSYSLTIDTTWTDAEANAAGWYNVSSSQTWANVMKGVTYWSFSHNNSGIVGVNATRTAHMDNFVMTPEPSTFALLACGLVGLLAYAWRKRK